MIYNLSMFRKIIFVVTVNEDVIGIQATRSVEKVLSTSDDFETTKNGITLVARLLQ